MSKSIKFQKGLLISLIVICSVFLVLSMTTSVQAAQKYASIESQLRLPCIFDQCVYTFDCDETNYFAICPAYCERPDGTWFCNGGYYCSDCN